MIIFLKIMYTFGSISVVLTIALHCWKVIQTFFGDIPKDLVCLWQHFTSSDSDNSIILPEDHPNILG